MKHTLTPNSSQSLVLTESDQPLSLVHDVGAKDGTAVIPATFRNCHAVCSNKDKDGGWDCKGAHAHRLDSNVISVTALGLDFDGISDSRWNEITTSLQTRRLHFLWWHTHGHIPGSGSVKARVLLPFETPYKIVNLPTWKALWKALTLYLDVDDTDKSCSNPSRIYYLPRKPTAESEHQSGESAGAPLRWDCVAAPVVADRPEVSSSPVFPPASPEDLRSARDELDLLGPALQGEGGRRKTFTAGSILARDFVLTDAEALPLLEDWNLACKPPWTSRELLERLHAGRDSGHGEWGSRRILEPLQKLDALISASDSSEKSQRELIRAARALRFNDPLDRGTAIRRLVVNTGLTHTEIDLPKIKNEPSVDKKPSNDYNFDVSTTGVPLDNLANVYRVLQSQPRSIWYDTFLQTIETENGTLEDKHLHELMLRLQRDIGLKRVSLKTVTEAVKTFAFQHPRNCAQEYFESLVWDNNRRLASFCTLGFGAVESEHTQSVGRNFFRAMVLRVMFPGCQSDNCIVLEGAEGIRKTSALRIIGGEWFAQAGRDMESKDFYLGLRGKMLLEIAELDAIRKTDESVVKSTLTCTIDHYREPYGLVTKAFPRQCVFAGTTNKDTWIDSEEVRRFWPIACTKVDTEWISAHRDQLFAEAVYDVKAGLNAWEVPESTRAEQLSRRHSDPWADELASFLSTQTEIRSHEILKNQLGISVDKMTHKDVLRVCAVLRKMGWCSKVVRKGDVVVKMWVRL